MKRAAAVLSLGILAFGGCASSGDAPSSSGDKAAPRATAKKPGKYDQTWPKPYGKTTCSQWTNKLDQHENFVAAADMLVGARSVDDEGAGLPDDDLVEEFRDAITTACVVPSMVITDVAVGVYLTEKATFKP